MSTINLNDYQLLSSILPESIRPSTSEIKLVQKYVPIKPPSYDQVIIVLLVVCLVALVILAISLSVIIMVYAATQQDVPDWFANGSNIMFQISAVVIPLIFVILVVVIVLMARNVSQKQKRLIVGLAIANTVLSGLILCATLAISVVLVLDLSSFINLTPLVVSLIVLPCSFATIIIPLVKKNKIEVQEVDEIKKVEI